MLISLEVIDFIICLYFGDEITVAPIYTVFIVRTVFLVVIAIFTTFEIKPLHRLEECHTHKRGDILLRRAIHESASIEIYQDICSMNFSNISSPKRKTLFKASIHD